MKALRRCLFCRSVRCYYRIHTEDRAFDELACKDHHREIEAYADAILDGKRRTMTMSSAIQSRGGELTGIESEGQR